MIVKVEGFFSTKFEPQCFINERFAFVLFKMRKVIEDYVVLGFL